MNNRQGWKDGVGALQWFVFLLANSVTLPIVVGQIYQLSPDEVIGLMQRIFLVAGVASFLQGCIGHKFPIPDGPAGTWLGVFAIMGVEVVHQNGDVFSTLRVLEMGMLTAGVMLLVSVMIGLTKWMLTLFTPLVTGSYLLLLGMQLGGVFLQGMLGVSGDHPQLDVLTTTISFGVFTLILVLSVKGKGWIKSYAVMIGILAGCLAYYGLGQGAKVDAEATVGLPEIFAWGLPKWDTGIMISSIVIALILTSNTIASIAAIKQVVQKQEESSAEESNRVISRSGAVGGFVQILSAVFSSVGTVPLSSAVGFVRMTGQTRIRPFLIASLLLAGIAFVPVLIRLLMLLPSPIAYSSIMASFVSLIGVGLQGITKESLDSRRIMIIGITILVGSGAMFLPASVFEAMPSVVKYVFGNGLILGTLVAILLELSWKAQKKAT
ncbi:purine/pyrimidine permease [Cohnella mopanensis]|uniref:purine/pyrimidine permease n=1 Tax=Cohnella mopanensis TaxID=2911966 RepID=UPI001EF98919|nr:purine/pyrimidine permease [Cohnella mopanensis]